MGSIEVRVLQATGNRVVELKGTPMELKTFLVCDATGQTKLTVWERLINLVQLGNCYKFDNVTTRKEGDQTVLTTTHSGHAHC